MRLEVEKITVLKGDGTDTCLVEFKNSIIEGVWPFENNLKMKFEVAHNRGEKYIKDNFSNVEVEIISIRG